MTLKVCNRQPTVHGPGFYTADVFRGDERIGSVFSYQASTHRSLPSGVRYDVRQVKRWGVEAPGVYQARFASRAAALRFLDQHVPGGSS